LGEDEPLAGRPNWLIKAIGDAPVLFISPRNSGSGRWPDPSPFYIQRSLPLLGRTVDSGRLADVLAAASQVVPARGEAGARWNVIGRGPAGVLAAYAAILEPGIAEAVLVDPPASHREGPIFVNVLRVLDIPEGLALLAPRPLTIFTDQPTAFDSTATIYRAAHGTLKIHPLP
jgi:hypothetical protein